MLPFSSTNIISDNPVSESNSCSSDSFLRYQVDSLYYQIDNLKEQVDFLRSVILKLIENK